MTRFRNKRITTTRPNTQLGGPKILEQVCRDAKPSEHDTLLRSATLLCTAQDVRQTLVQRTSRSSWKKNQRWSRKTKSNFIVSTFFTFVFFWRTRAASRSTFSKVKLEYVELLVDNDSGKDIDLSSGLSHVHEDTQTPANVGRTYAMEASDWAKTPRRVYIFNISTLYVDGFANKAAQHRAHQTIQRMRLTNPRTI
eukprot:4542552-Pyramimonas_sp.AAC.1